MGGLLDNNKSIHKDAKGEAEHSHWRQRSLVRLWPYPTRSHKQEWTAWDQWDQCLSMSKLLAQAHHAWYPEMVSWNWKLSLKRASYRWWSKWKRKVSRLHKWSWDGVIWRDQYLSSNCFRSVSRTNYITPHHTWTVYALSEFFFCSSVLFLISDLSYWDAPWWPVKMSSNDLPVGRTLLVPCAPLQKGA